MFDRIITTVLLAAIIALLFLLQSTNPSTSSPGVILSVFVLLYIILFVFVIWLLRSANWILRKLTYPIVVKKPFVELSQSRAAYLASVIAIAPIMLMAMASVGRLGLYEIFLVIIFVALGIFYVERRTL